MLVHKRHNAPSPELPHRWRCVARQRRCGDIDNGNDIDTPHRKGLVHPGPASPARAYAALCYARDDCGRKEFGAEGCSRPPHNPLSTGRSPNPALAAAERAGHVQRHGKVRVGSGDAHAGRGKAIRSVTPRYCIPPVISLGPNADLPRAAPAGCGVRYGRSQDRH